VEGAPPNEDDEDLEELDEEEKAARHMNMLKDFREKIEREESSAQQRPHQHYQQENESWPPRQEF